MNVDFRGGSLFYKVLALLSGCPSPGTLDPSPAEHPHWHRLMEVNRHNHTPQVLPEVITCGRKSCVVPNKGFSGQCPLTTSDDSHPGSSAPQDTTVCRQGRAQPSELRCTSRGWSTSLAHSGALRCLVWANCGMFLQESHGFPSHHVQAAPGGFPAWTCIPDPRDPFWLPRQHPRGPIYTKLQLSEAL